MFAKIKSFFTPPVFPDDEDKTRTAHILFILLTSLLTLMVLVPLGIIFAFKEKLLSSILVGIMFAWVLFLYILARRGRVQLAGALLVGGLWIFVTLDQFFLIARVNTVFAAIHVSLMVLAGILLGIRSAILVAYLSGTAGLILALLEQTGHPLHPYFPGAPLADWFNFAVALLLTLVPLNLTLKLMTQSLERVRRENEERQRLEKMRGKLILELEQRNAELERFAYTVSHDLRNPLVTIKGFIGMLGRDMQEQKPEQVQHDMERIANATDKMDDLLSELLELSRIGRIVNPPEEIDTVGLVQDALELLDAKIGSSNVKIVVARELPVLYGDRVRLLEVFENLIDNAIKYTGNQSEPAIEIGVRNTEGQQIVFVKDNGLGIEKRYHAKIFGLFEKLDPTIEGTGIGLALVQRIVETHGGRIWVESEGLGKGSTFCFTIPDGRRQENEDN